MIFSEEVLKKVFEESFGDKVKKINKGRSYISLCGESYIMTYDFINECITFGGTSLEGGQYRFGTIFVSEYNISSYGIDPCAYYSYHIRLFELKLKKFIESSKKRTRRKFISR